MGLEIDLNKTVFKIADNKFKIVRLSSEIDYSRWWLLGL